VELIDTQHNIAWHPLVATIGFFDGVHTGHKYLIEQLEEAAKAERLPSAVITFPEHPRRVLNTDYQPALLCGYEEKLARLAATGIDYCVALDFTPEMSMMSAEDFICKVLKDTLHVKTLLIGYDHRFGHNREGSFAEYKQYGQKAGIEVIQAKELSCEPHVSSTQIRRLLHEGNITKANELLGYNYTISGKIVEGFKVGRTIGFPTANIKIWEDFKVVPAFGVYAVYVHTEGQKYSGMLYIGKRPTLHNGENISLEVNIFDFNEDLYGKSLTAEFIDFVRPDQKFSDMETLAMHIRQDKANVARILAQYSR
jgi:riboflavin kinase/FMN adenylyltransferase